MEDEERNRKRNLGFFFRYISPYRREMVQLVLGMVTASVLQLILPFLTQSLVDTGIRDNNLGFITLILISQLVIFIAKLSVDFIRSWILLHVNTRINIALISDFLAKLMRLPLHFFDTKMVGDIMQRIGDHDRIEAFVNFIVFGFVLAYYDWTILGLFLAGDRGYKGKKEINGTQIVIPDVPKNKDSYYTRKKKHKLFCKRAGIEPTSGHLKTEYLLLSIQAYKPRSPPLRSGGSFRK